MSVPLVTDEPVRGNISPPWFHALPGIERIEALARGYISTPPLLRLTGIRPGHIGPGSGTWTMPASPWMKLTGVEDELDISMLAEIAASGIATTVLPPGVRPKCVTLSIDMFRPARMQSGSFVARGRVVNASRFFTCTEVEVEDSRGRLLFHASSIAELQTVTPPPPPPPADLKRVDEAAFSVPDPWRRPASSSSASAPGGMGLSDNRRIYHRLAEDFVPLGFQLLGVRCEAAEEGQLRLNLRASEWLCLFDQYVSPGILAVIVNGASYWSGFALTESSHSFVGLDHHTQFHWPIPADGRDIHIVAEGAIRGDRYGSGKTAVYDAEQRLAAEHVGAGKQIDATMRMKATSVEARRVLCTLLFTDIVGSTEHAERLGDRAWNELLDRHRRAIRNEIERCHGMEVDTAGDGFFVRFDSPADALDCAEVARDAVKGLGIEIRAGIHTGECEVTGRHVAGMAVHAAARIMAAAGPSDILLSATVKDLVMGSGRAFSDRGEHELKNVPGAWRLYALTRP